MKWDYGPAGDRWPVNVGDVWQVGQHIFLCGDLETGVAYRFLGRFGDPDMTYSDPPWNTGNANAFLTKAGHSRRTNIEDFLIAFCGPIWRTRGAIFTEMGNQSLELLQHEIRRIKGFVIAVWPITYYRRNPTNLVLWGNNPQIESSLSTALNYGPGNMDDEDTPSWAIGLASRPGDLIFDPCTGRGLTPISAHKLGRRAIGIELHPRRLAVTLDKLHNLGAGVPEQIGEMA